jgi:hypothetical protein
MGAANSFEKAIENGIREFGFDSRHQQAKLA